MKVNTGFFTVTREVCVSTLSCLTCWNRKHITMSDDVMKDLTRAPEMSQKVICDILVAEAKLLKNAKFCDVYVKSTFFDENGLYDQVKTIKNNKVKEALSNLLKEWSSLYIRETDDHNLNEDKFEEKCSNVENDFGKNLLVKKLNELANDKGLKSVRIFCMFQNCNCYILFIKQKITYWNLINIVIICSIILIQTFFLVKE